MSFLLFDIAYTEILNITPVSNSTQIFYIYDPHLKTWVSRFNLEELLTLNCIDASEQKILYMDLTLNLSIPVLSPKVFLCTDSYPLNLEDSVNCLDNILCDPNFFHSDVYVSDILSDPNLYKIKVISTYDTVKAQWDSTYFFYNLLVGKDIYFKACDLCSHKNF